MSTLDVIGIVILSFCIPIAMLFILCFILAVGELIETSILRLYKRRLL